MRSLIITLRMKIIVELFILPSCARLADVKPSGAIPTMQIIHTLVNTSKIRNLKGERGEGSALPGLDSIHCCLALEKTALAYEFNLADIFLFSLMHRLLDREYSYPYYPFFLFTVVLKGMKS